MKRIKLEDLDRNLPYREPAGYFDKLPATVQSRIYEQTVQKENPFSVSWSWKRTALTGAAASIVGVLLWVTYPQKQLSLSEETLSQVTNDEILTYLKDHNISQQEVIEQTQAPIESEEEVLFQQLNVNDEDLKRVLQDENIEEMI